MHTEENKWVTGYFCIALKIQFTSEEDSEQLKKTKMTSTQYVCYNVVVTKFSSNYFPMNIW